MQVKVQKLREVMKLLEPVIPKKTALPVLHNVLLKDGQAIAGDLETFILVDLPEADMECLIPHKSVMQLLKYVPGNELLTIEADGSLKFSWDGGKSSFPLAKAEDFPSMPEFTVKAEGTIDGNLLVTAMTAISRYCATEENRPVLCGVAVFPGENLDVAAGDGYRMAYQTIQATLPIAEPLVIPAAAVWLLDSLLKHTRPDVPLGDSLVGLVTNKRMAEVSIVESSSGLSTLRVCFSHVTVFVKLIQGTPPNFKQLMPKETPTNVKFFSEELERAIKRLSAVARAGTGIVRLSWTNDTMTVSTISGEMGTVEGTLPVQADNPDRVGINIKYLLEYLDGKEGLITMSPSGGTAPVLFRHRASPLVLVMPMNVQW